MGVVDGDDRSPWSKRINRELTYAFLDGKITKSQLRELKDKLDEIENMEKRNEDKQ